MADINGTSGNDTLTGTTGDDTVLGLGGNDLLIGDAGADLLQGDTGSDTLNGGGGNDSLDGGAITDRINYADLNVVVYSSATAGVNVNLQTGTASDGLGGTDTLANLNFVVGSAQNDTLTGSSTANLFEQFEGGAGDDTIDGGAIDPVNQQNSNRVNYSSASGAVTVNLASGTATGAAGSDTLININHVRGGNSADVLTGSNSTLTEQFEGRAGNDTIDGAGGTDMVRYDSATEGVNVSLVTNTASDGLGGTDTLSNIEGIRGSNLNDTLTGGNTANGTGTTDGFEFFMGQGGNDTIDGGAGYDRVDYTSSTTGASVTLGGSSNGTASDGLGGTDTLINIEAVRGTEFNDALTGSDTGTFESFEGRGGNDTIDGKGGTDRVDYQSATAAVSVNIATGTASDGYGGTDSFSNIENARGSAFNDTLSGDANANRLEGSAGNDTLTGGASSDAFVFALGSMDTVTDFVAGAGGDVIDVQSAVAGFTNFGGGNPFATGHLKLVQAGADTQLQADSDGTGTGVFQTIAVLTNVTAANLTTANFAGGYDPTATPAGVNLVGTAGADSLTGGAGNDTVSGLGGNDTLSGTSGNDSISGGDGVDSLIGGDGNDTLLGGADADTLLGGGGSDSLDGGAILDRINLADLNFTSYLGATSGVNINLATGVVQDGQGGTDTLVNINFVLASNFDDTVTGSTTSDLFEQFEGGTGNDTIDGGVVDPVLQRNGNRATYHSASAAVTVNLATGTAMGGAGTDTLININHVRGSGYNDVLTGSNSNLTEQFEGRAGNDTIDGAGGTDMVRYDSATEAVNVSLATNTASDGLGGTDTLSNIEGIRGSSFADTLTGGNPANGSGATDGFEFFMGQGGNDTIDGGAGFDRTDYSTSTAGANVTLGGTGNGTASDGLGGTDTLISVEGVRGSSLNDTLTGSDTGTFETFEGREGNDTIDGKGGTDRVDYSFATTGAVVDLATGTASDGYGFTDTLSNIENIRGSAFDDVLTGNAGNNDILGQGGNDTLNGGDGHDTLDGSTGADSLSGGNGNDYLRAADGANDTLDGGADTDVAAYSFGGTSAVTFTATGASGTQADGLGGTDTLVSIEEMHIFTGSGADTITGDSLRNYIQANGGNDTLTGGAGNDTFAYDFSQTNGTDRITDLQGGDNFSFNHFGGALVVLDSTIQTGDNPAALTRGQIMVGAPSGGVTKIYVGTDNTAGGDLTIELQGNYLASDFSVFNSGFGGNLNYNPGQNLTGTAGNDTLNGGISNDTLDGLGGNDNLSGNGGSDSLLGGEGDDYITAGGDGASDTVNGGGGFDVYSNSFFNQTNPVTFTSTGPSGTQADPFGGTDTITNVEEFHIFGGSAGDTLTGDGQRNWIQGNGGNDTLAGGAGNDTFAYDFGQASGTDRITDLQGGDSFSFNHFGGALVVLDSTIQTGDNPAALTRGQIMVGTPSGGVTKIYVGTDNTAGGDLTIELQGSYLASDFTVSNHSFGGNLNYGPGQTLTGTAGNDSLMGGNGNDTLTGLDGADSLNGSGGNDSLDGGNQNDQLRGESGNDTILGGDGNDFITGGSGDDSINGGSGTGDTADYFYSDTSAAITVNLGTGAVTGGAGTDTLAGIENVNASDFADSITGDANANFLEGRAGNDTLLGAGGSDNLIGGAGNDSLDGGAITDRLNYTDLNTANYSNATTGVNVNLQSGTASDGLGGTDTLSNLNFVVGSAQNDTLTGSSTGNLFEQFEGGLGDDTMDGGVVDPVLQNNSNRVNYSSATGAVSVNLGAGTATGGAGSDTLFNINHARGSNFADVLTGSNSSLNEEFEGRAGNDTIDGAGGILDMVRYDSATVGVNVNLVTNTASDGLGGTDTLSNIEGIRGSNFNDILTGGNTANGSGATDGFEFFRGLGGDDTIDGGAGYDRVDYINSTTGASVTLGGSSNGTASDGLGGTDTLINIEAVRGTEFNDTLTGSDTGVFESFEGRSGNDTIDGKGGTDRIDYQGATAGVSVNIATGTASDGSGGTDSFSNIEDIRGSAFNDTLTGDANVNRLEGGAGNDTLTGGAGNDVFAFAPAGVGVDTVTDFGVGDIVGIGATLTAGTATAGDGSTVTGKSVQVSSSGGVTTLWIDTNNTAGAELQINLTGTFAASSFTVTDNLDGRSSITRSGGLSLTGTSGNDTLTGGTDNDTLDGLDGHDTLDGGAGNDSLRGGNGDDWFVAGGGADTLDGGAGFDRANYVGATAGIVVNMATGTVSSDGSGSADTLVGIERVMGSNFADSITGSGADDDFSGNLGNDTLDGGAGFDFVWYGNATAAVQINLQAGTATGGEGTDQLVSIEGVAGSRFADDLQGSSGDNYFRGDGGLSDLAGGNDTINGQGGFDVVDYRDDPAAVTVNLQTLTAQDGRGAVDTLASIEEVRGSNFNDSITGSTELWFERFEGRDGNDTIDGGAITDTVNQTNGNQVSYRFATGGVAVDLLAGSATGAAGSDTLSNINEARGSAFNDTLSGSNRTDVTELFEGREGDDTIDGRGGFDIVRFDNATSSVTASLVSGTATGGGIGSDTFTNVEGLWGSSHADVLTGGNAANGTSANDPALSEFFVGGAGSDTIDGGQGYDLASYQNSTAAVTVTLNDTLDGAGNDGFGGTDVLRSIEGVRGSAHNDVLTGSNSAAFESFEGREGNDTIDGLGGTDRADYARSKAAVVVNLATGSASDGYGGTDTLTRIENVRGSTFSDTITGDANANRLEGGLGNDTLTGGAGNDVFAFAASGMGVDTITDFAAGDIVGVGATLTAGTATAGNGSAVTGKNVQVSSSGGVTTLWVDTNNVAGAELQINLTGTFSANSFKVAAGGNGTSSISFDMSKVAADFNGDRVSDLVWRNSTTGANVLWKGADSAQPQQVTGVGSPTSWKLAAISDFNGDGLGDLLWRNISTGSNAIWRSGDSSQVQAVTAVGDVNFKMSGVGDFNGDGKADILWRNVSTGANVIWRSANSNDIQTISNVADLNFFVAGVGDFNGDGIDDVLWRNSSTGSNVVWRSGNSNNPQTVSSAPSPAWKVAGIGDFDGDRISDILWRNEGTGQNVIWRAANSLQAQAVTSVGDLNWKVVGTGDYSGDGASDVLWRNGATGANVIWRSADSGNAQAVSPVGDLTWAIQSQTGTWPVEKAKSTQFDVNGDGKSDLLWRNISTGSNAVWKEANAQNSEGVVSVSDVNWKIAGFADFNGDGKADILWRNATTGANSIWGAANASTPQGVNAIPDTNWKVAGLGDFDGDGAADILWRNTSNGSNAIWKSGNASTSQGVDTVSDMNWSVSGVGDFDGDGRADILWRNASTGANAIWKNASSASGQAVSAIPDLNWKVAGVADFNADGAADILWRNSSTGQNALWRSGDSTNGQHVNSVADLNYRVVGTGDYNGDGRADILWKSGLTGSAVAWNGGDSATPISVVGVPDSNWTNPGQTGNWLNISGVYPV